MKSVLLVGGGILQQKSIEAAHQLGYAVILTDKNPNCFCTRLADEFYPLDTRDAAGHTELARSRRGELAAVFTAAHSVELTVAAAANAIGLPAIPNEVAYRISNKAAMRECLEGKIPQPRWQILENYRKPDLEFPFVVKATDNSGSRGLTKVFHADDFTEEVFNRARENSGDRRVLIEELLVPVEGEIAEQSVETIWYEGKGHWLNWVDRPFRNDGKFAIEEGHYNPAAHSLGTETQIEQMVLTAGKVLGMTTGIFKADMMLTLDGPRILETTARLSGGFDSTHTSPLAHGVNYVRGALKLALGQIIDWYDFTPLWDWHAVALSKFPKPGKIISISGIADAEKITGVEYVISRMSSVDRVPPYEDCAARPLFVIAAGETREKAIQAARTGLEQIRIETQ